MAVYQQVLTQNGFIDKNDLYYPFEERGLQFGDGIYEVIRIYHGKYYLLNEHVERLYRSAESLKLKLPFQKSEMYVYLDELLEINQISSDAKVYLQATRGSAPRDHVFPDADANLYAYAQDLARPLDKLENGVATITRPDIRWQNCYIKSLNLLPNVMMKQEAKEHGCFETILHRDNVVTECSSSNAYIVKDGTIYTHPETNNILHGCVRLRVKKLVKDLNIPFKEEAFTLSQLHDADEVFLSSSTAEVMPITKVDDTVIQDGTPGKITKAIQQAYEKDAGLR
ncbi:D-amino-acid transaminase [Aquibacillus albus]|uniref:D-alanine aminotransferase n=1 Tax=Aquibacillus albus TaxID=1168171 RepID=A0ABS2N0R7_9BACI|nr:D-amino-acid transaminase [Aquibacillus albus]MBM7571638.1 D-alanine transaminase [Aquibacillus albus]